MNTKLYEVEVIALDNLGNYNENLSFINEPNNDDMSSYLRLIRPNRKFSTESIKFQYIKELTN